MAFSVSFSFTPRVALVLFSLTFVGAGFTVMVADADLPLSVTTVIFVVPVFSAVTFPFFETVATEGLEEDQVKPVSASSGVSVFFSVRVSPTARVASDFESAIFLGGMRTWISMESSMSP